MSSVNVWDLQRSCFLWWCVHILLGIQYNYNVFET